MLLPLLILLVVGLKNENTGSIITSGKSFVIELVVLLVSLKSVVKSLITAEEMYVLIIQDFYKSLFQNICCLSRLQNSW